MTKLILAGAIALALTGATQGSGAKGRHYTSHPSQAHHRASYGHHNASVFCDRVTASGGMNCAANQFAHRTLPLGSWHVLCSHRGCVQAQVVDRGPAAWTGRSFDLSTGLARRLGVDGLGTISMR